MSIKLNRQAWCSYGEDEVGLLGWFIVTSIVATQKNKGIDRIDIGGTKSIDADGKEIVTDEISMRVNGVELDILDCFRRLQGHMDKTTATKAAAMLSTLCNVEIGQITHIIKEAKDSVRQKLQQALGIEIPDEEE